jgi:hypothetical protein
LRPGTNVLWRDDSTVQLELGGRRIVIENVTSELIGDLLGRSVSQLRTGRTELTRLRRELSELGFLRSCAVRPAPPAYLAPELACVSRSPGGDDIFQRRRAATVAVYGSSRITAVVAATLAAAGVGRIELADTGRVRAGDACPGGLSPADEGQTFLSAATAAVKRAAPDVLISRIGLGPDADLAVLSDPVPVDTAIREDLQLRSMANLSVSVDGAKAVLGPLVLPGVTSCLHCADLHRTDRDPAWPLLAVQLANRSRRTDGSNVTLSVAAAGLAAAQVLAFLDASAAPPGAQEHIRAEHRALPAEPRLLGATVEWDFPDWRLRRRTWPPHPECNCGAAPDSVTAGRMDG